MNRLEFYAEEADEGSRIDKWLCVHEPGFTRSALQRLIESNSVFVNNKPVNKNYKLKNSDQVVVIVPEPEPLEAKPQNIPIDVIYEDDDLLVVNKPKGMVVHPAAGNPDGTLVNALLYHCKGRLSGINGVIRPGIVHRIDKLTSGLLIIAKNDTAHNILAEQIRLHSFTREYRAVNCGRFKELSGTVDAPIGRSKYDRKKMCVIDQNSKRAVTHYEVIDEFGQYSMLKFRLETGRTHQIRVHSAYIGHPVLGDSVYGKPFKGLDGQCLHAKKIGFIHPSTKEYMEFDSELPDYFSDILKKLKA
ncbi:RluA family pseudouridine synthase [Ruminococcus sp. Marseille-P6503]|uniref:RluA family pseudouridine synthase n=1 Tax=Ruminococcus sp. Marseille-P6503 TaxID=2364796 RepID=UPI000F54A141|nr:RluA family pseudouridine synthase [Ruminococcus sp. Marseille-P6503]